MNIKKNALLTLLSLCALGISSCSVCTHSAVADMGRSAEAILLPLETPTLYQVDKEWYMLGHKANVERCNASWVDPEYLPADKQHPERYELGSSDMTPAYAAIPASLAESLQKGRYTHSDAISFINRKWVDSLPEGEVKEVRLSLSAPDYFRHMSSHRIMHTDQGNFLLARIGEMTADFSAVYAYPLAGISAILIDVPGSIFYIPPTQQKQKAQPETLE